MMKQLAQVLVGMLALGAMAFVLNAPVDFPYLWVAKWLAAWLSGAGLALMDPTKLIAMLQKGTPNA